MTYIPDRGDMIWIAFNPQAVYEQAGRRPALVLSPVAYNSRVGLALLCPITARIKGYPFEVLLPEGLKFQCHLGFINDLSIDFHRRELPYPFFHQAWRMFHGSHRFYSHSRKARQQLLQHIIFILGSKA